MSWQERLMTVIEKPSSSSTKALRIGELSQASGVPTKTIRYYEDVGLLPPAQRAENGYRLYGDEDVQRLRFIRNARSLDFSLDDLREILALRDQKEAPCRYVVQLLEKRAVEVEERVRQLRTLRAEMQQLLAEASKLPDDDIEMKACVCHLIYNRS
jgi:DNA-binding transcriptional MerR regulator